ncbi:metallophosphoesterase [Frankia sp. CNm7]|uniref:Metallophosphoesterase n=1 Tax=Frankia nepalensis TaxID=1836974 RepID=A0A937RC46_9ACTN|nr:metallophosphoesterase [Frankia nepalensis]MBL7496574.1 metallophosphoesterase [Frankia nepalensis]MBL7508793.1 metallophosphoesterase [Frankia nepalensis]MBL7521464.1 metallophosphoesterase [Frankia nepalensis]MBL7627547.1 metallophosphoesterase [Frankia nepalensis]
MKIAFVGDVHGCVRHALGAAVLLQERRGIRLDAVIQVGDLGAYPSPERFDGASRRFARDNPAQDDFFRLLDPSPRFAEGVRGALGQVGPMLFVSGNHEDHDWLAGLHEAAGADVVPVDPGGACRHVACGSVLALAGQRVAFLGLIEVAGKMDLDERAYTRLMGLEPGDVDVLVTHDGPYGMSRDWRGNVQGSAKLSRLIEHLQPWLHVSGHYHHVNGPRRYGRTTSYALHQLVRPKASRWDPASVNPEQRVTAGSVGLLDTDAGDFTYVHDDWLADVRGDALDLAGLVAATR